jgi:hypothetical protein
MPLANWRVAVSVSVAKPLCRSASAALALLILGCGDPPAAPAGDDPPPSSAAPVRAAPQGQASPAVTPPAARHPREVFWSRMQALCGNAYAGFLTVGTEPSDRDFGEADLKIDIRTCDDTSIRMPFHVSDDRSRTFVLQRADDVLTLHHRHVNRDGSPADPDGYGGRSIDDGTASRQEFPADEATQAALPASATNVWALEIEPGNYLAYELKRVEDDRYFRVEFDLQQTIPALPAPWGAQTP